MTYYSDVVRLPRDVLSLVGLSMTAFPVVAHPRNASAPVLESPGSVEASASGIETLETSPERIDTVWCWQGSRLVALASRAAARFSGETCGASALEYTVILAMIIASLYLGIEYLARPAVDTFARVGASASDFGGETGGQELMKQSPIGFAGGLPHLDQGVTNLVFIAFIFTLSVVLLGSMIWRHWTAPEEEQEDEKVATESGPNIFDKRQKIARTLSVHLHELLEHGMTVGHVMSKLLSPIHVDTPRTEVERLMTELHIRHLIVVDNDGQLCGIISDRDLSRRHGSTAGAMMTANPLSTNVTSPLNPAITLLIQRKISCLPVVDEGRPIGVLTTTDVMMTLQCMLHEMHKLGEKERKANAKPRAAAPPAETAAPPTSLV